MIADIDFASVSSRKAKAQKAQDPSLEPEIIEGALIIQIIQSKAIIDAYLPQAEMIRDQAFAIKIVDNESRVQASETGTRIKNLVKDVNLAVENVIKKPDFFVKEIKNGGKKIIVELERGKHYLADELLKDKQRQDLQRAKEQEAIRIADEVRRKALKKEAKRLKIEPPPLPMETILPKKTKEETQTRTDAGVSFATGRWTYELLDITKLPREYLLPKENGPLINQRIKQGLRDELDKAGKVIKPAIEGIRIYFKEDISFR